MNTLTHDHREVGELVRIRTGALTCPQATGMSQSLVSYHLRELREAGLVESSAAGPSNRYRLASADLDQLASLLGRLQVDTAAGA